MHWHKLPGRLSHRALLRDEPRCAFPRLDAPLLLALRLDLPPLDTPSNGATFLRALTPGRGAGRCAGRALGRDPGLG
ncbi:MAG: hypothetical protein WBN41_07650, partial [Lysobacterales bacterium]